MRFSIPKWQCKCWPNPNSIKLNWVINSLWFPLQISLSDSSDAVAKAIGLGNQDPKTIGILTHGYDVPYLHLRVQVREPGNVETREFKAFDKDLPEKKIGKKINNALVALVSGVWGGNWWGECVNWIEVCWGECVNKNWIEVDCRLFGWVWVMVWV